MEIATTGAAKIHNMHQTWVRGCQCTYQQIQVWLLVYDIDSNMKKHETYHQFDLTWVVIICLAKNPPHSSASWCRSVGHQCRLWWSGQHDWRMLPLKKSVLMAFWSTKEQVFCMQMHQMCTRAGKVFSFHVLSRFVHRFMHCCIPISLGGSIVFLAWLAYSCSRRIYMKQVVSRCIPIPPWLVELWCLCWAWPMVQRLT